MTRVSPFLTFSGQCTQAMALYEKALKAKVTYKKEYDANKNLIFHAQMKVGKHLIMLCDGDDTTLGSGKEQRASEVCLCAEFDTPEEVKAAFDIMSDGAKIIEPFSSASYSKSFVFLEDKFGIRWWLMTAE